jgi:hypothetical protein
MTRHEKIDPSRPIGFDEPGAAYDAVSEGRLTEADALDVLKRAIQQGLDSGQPQEPRTLDQIKTEGRRRLALLRGQ